jgi:hypothetical protein
MPLTALVAAAVAAQAPAAPLPPPLPLTREEARTAPVHVLARRLLGDTGALVREMERPPPEPYPNESWLRQVVFASAPRWARIAGLCQADLFLLGFEPAAEASDGQEPPVRVSDLATSKTFRAIGDPDAAGVWWTEEEQRQFGPACAASGPVLSQGGGWFSGSTPARGFDGNDAAFAIRAYRRATSAAATGRLTTVPCRDEAFARVPPICGAPAATLASLSPNGAVAFLIAPCSPDDDVLCVTATVPRNIDALGDQRRIEVTIRTDRSATYPQGQPIGIDGVSLRAVTIVF